jgi:hypothetical protein
MSWETMASLQVNELTRTRSSGRPTNMHVVERAKPIEIDFVRMRDVVHTPMHVIKTEPA